jgi:hypothetical protein
MVNAKSFLIVFIFVATNSVFAECTVFPGCAECDKYIEEFFDDNFKTIRNSFAYRYKPSTGTIGFYTHKSKGEENCPSIEIDHVVSIKEAFCRGLPRDIWENFANDPENHVEACSSINKSKGASGPDDFRKKANNNDGTEYEIVNLDQYLEKYYYILKKYDLLRQGEGSDAESS